MRIYACLAEYFSPFCGWRQRGGRSTTGWAGTRLCPRSSGAGTGDAVPPQAQPLGKDRTASVQSQKTHKCLVQKTACLCWTLRGLQEREIILFRSKQ